jgi:hypothetical protein
MPSNRIFLGLHFVVAKCKLFQTVVNISHEYCWSSICKFPFSYVSHTFDVVFVGCGLIWCCSLNARKQIWSGKQYTPTNNQPMPIVFLEDFELGPHSSITQQGSVSTTARANDILHLTQLQLRLNTPQPKAMHQREKLVRSFATFSECP